MTKLRITIDDAPLRSGHAVRGMGFYTRNLIEALEDNKDIELSDNNYEVIHYPYFDLFSNTLKPPLDKKVVVTVPDVIPLLYPKHYPPGIKRKLNLLRQKRALKQVDAVITISETSKKDIVRLLDMPAEKVFVTLLGPGNPPLKTTTKLNLPNEFVLYVGDINWNKNLINFVSALSESSLKGVIVGKNARDLIDNPQEYDFRHPQLSHLKDLYRLLKDSKNVKVLGYLEDEEFAAVYQQATIYCQPSFYEGFGMPLLEAMQYDKPLVAARTQALVEVADDSALYFDPYSIKNISETLRTLGSDVKLKNNLLEKGRKRLKEFSWKKCAEETINVYRHVL